MDTASQDAAFVRRICDIAELSGKQHRTKYTMFLTEREQAVAENALRRLPFEHRFFGGYDNSVRKILGVAQSGNIIEEYDFPMTALTITFRTEDKLSHRDFLGSLMALGIKRETVGDIVVGDGYAVMFCCDTVCPVVLDELSMVGRVGVNAESGIQKELPQQRFEEINEVVSSLRLDCVVSCVAGMSRENAAKAIASAMVSVNSLEITDKSYVLEQNDVLTVRGEGKFILAGLNGSTRKSKLKILLKKYL